MIEAQRLAYLEAMGVDSYMPRRRLVLAPEPQLCETLAYRPAAAPSEVARATQPDSDRVASNAQQQPQSPAQAQPEQARQEAPVRERPAFDWDEGKAGAKGSPESGKANRAAERSQAPAFKLKASIATSDQGWLIVDASQTQLSASQMMPWAAQLIRAMTGQSGECHYSVFNWPLPRTQSLGVSEAEACESFCGMLAGAVERNQVRYVLLLGEAMREWVLPPELQVIRGPSIANMRSNPQAKALLWQSMRRFVRTLG